ncbi:CRISPR system Cascade subunit CasA [Lipingzhangella halophila]|uniref:CRISPR system Cascade subunit CasA n=1 Tax=Lipingzhangella halophila TaxID=1783352 RepID=A0A7W7RJW6_9ACTN|nr:type I-E CRISPR-associated protein Cse1/CasA [Lipingzhangella halophila]MBB4933310.1 CRISPR system Cascade subunit CasA [Lipingzhangella halophila]
MPNDPDTFSFDLTERPWIPVQWLDGSQTELALPEVFRWAPRLRRVVGDIPTQEFALLRLLLAIVHDAVDGPEDTEHWRELWEGGIPAEEIAAYLEQHRHRLDLLHPETPFFQVVDLRTAKDEISSLDRIVGDVPNGTPFFTMRARGTARLGFAEAARWVVHAHAYDPSGIKSGVLGDPRVKNGKGYPQGVGWAGGLGGVFVEGDDLRQTLLLNLVATDTDHLRAAEADRPAWRFDPPGAAPLEGKEKEERPYGVRDLYTWQGRRLRLRYDTDGVYGVVLAYGDPLEAHNRHNREPMTGWRRSPAQEKKRGEPQVYLPREHEPARSAWRGLASLLADQAPGSGQRQDAAEGLRPRILEWVARLTVEGYLDENHLVRARLVGAVYGTQQSVIDEVVDDRVVMAVALLHEDNPELARTAIDAVSDAEAAVTALGNLAADLAQAVGADPGGPRAATRDRGFGELDGPFRDWLATLGRSSDSEERRATWQRTARRAVARIAAELVENAGETAWSGRLVSTGNGDLWLNSAHAERRFHRELSRKLPMSTREQTAEVPA